MNKVNEVLLECQKFLKPIRFILEAHEMSILLLVPLCKNLILFPNLVSLQLNLSKNYLNMNALQELGKTIQQTMNVRFWDLDFSYNPKLDNFGHLILQDLSSLSQLEKLNVSLNNTNQNSQCAIFASKCVKNNQKTLKHINFQFRNCFQISDDSVGYLFNELYDLTQIISLGLGLDILSKHQQIKHLSLNISQCEIQKKELEKIAMSIYNMSEIKKLEFGCFGYKQNSLFKETIGIFLKNKLILSDLELDLSDNSLDDSNLKDLVFCLKNLPALKNVKLNLSKNQQFSKGVIDLGNFLKEKEIKGSLDIRYCKIDQNIVIRISNMLIMQLYLTQK